MMQALTLNTINSAPIEEVLTALDGLYEHSPWIVEKALENRPFTSLLQLKEVMKNAVTQAGLDAQLALIRAHPELAGKAMVNNTLTSDSTNEQSKAGLAHCTQEEFMQLQTLNAQYKAKFGFPFILAVRGPDGKGLGRQAIIHTFAARLENTPVFEHDEALRNIHRIAEIRLHDRLSIDAQVQQ